MSKVIRVSDEVHQQVSDAARLLRRTPAEMIDEAWHAYLATPEFREDFQTAHKAFATGDLRLLADALEQRSRERASATAARVREMFEAGE